VAAPQQFALLGNYPNPFREQTQVGYRLPTAAVVTVEVYDALGRQVERLDEDAKKAGSHTAHIDASDLSSGVYFYRVEIKTEGGEKHRKSGKMVLVR
jgi:phosphodiesterase/alkaline phosphatase D-like protein